MNQNAMAIKENRDMASIVTPASRASGMILFDNTPEIFPGAWAKNTRLAVWWATRPKGAAVPQSAMTPAKRHWPRDR